MATAQFSPLPDDFRTISTAQRNEFRDNGHILIHGLLSADEIAVWRPLIEDLVKKHGKEKRKMPDRGAYGKEFGQLVNLWQVDRAMRQFVLWRRLGKVAADLLGAANVRIYHDQALFKEAGGAPSHWHQDQFYWPLDTPDTITMSISLVDQSLDMGMFVFASGSHKKGTVQDPKFYYRPDSLYRKYIRENHFPLTCAAGLHAGDASFHFGNTVHHTSGNNSDRQREIMSVSYMADGARVTQPLHKAQVAELNSWLMGLPPGRLAATELNPLVL